ncbi:hypothetical protein HK405_003959 [Cladochytrium tenue]|nr:hypothetical protein HK405_003959 [Cladochytrium tenue]
MSSELHKAFQASLDHIPTQAEAASGDGNAVAKGPLADRLQSLADRLAAGDPAVVEADRRLRALDDVHGLERPGGNDGRGQGQAISAGARQNKWPVSGEEAAKMVSEEARAHGGKIKKGSEASRAQSAAHRIATELEGAE